MAYIIQRKDRFYVVSYDGVDPLTGKERRRWHPVGHDRTEAEACAARLDNDHAPPRPVTGGPITLGRFLTDTWMPQKRRHVRATTAYRYAWFIERYVNPAIGDVPLRRLRPTTSRRSTSRWQRAAGETARVSHPRPSSRST